MEMKIKMKLNFWDSTNDNVNVDIGTVNKEGKYNFTSLPPSLLFHFIPSYFISSSDP